MINLKEVYRKIVYTLDSNLDVYDFLNKVIALAQYCEDDIDDLNSKDYFVDKFIKSEIKKDNSRGSLLQTISLVDALLCKEFEYSNYSDEMLIEIIRPFFTLEYRYDYAFVPALAEYIRRYDSILHDNLRPTLFYLIISYPEILYEIEQLILSGRKQNFLDLMNYQDWLGNVQLQLFNRYFDTIEKREDVLDVTLATFLSLNKNLIPHLFNNYISSFVGQETMINKVQIPRTGNTKDSAIDIFYRRSNYLNHKSETLESIGQSYNVTRERIRQIEQNMEKKVLNVSRHKFINIIYDFYYSIHNSSNKPYFTIEDFYNHIEGDNKDFVLIYMDRQPDSIIKINNDLGIVYDSTIFDLDEAIEIIKKKYGICIPQNVFDSANVFDKNIIKLHYNQKSHGSYVQKGITTNDLIANVLKIYFPNGAKLSQLKKTEDYLKIEEIYEKDYGISLKEAKPRLLCAQMERGDKVICCDRGVYIDKSYSPTLDDDFIAEVNSYITNNGPILRYQAIYDYYKTYLNSLGINNHYYLKSLIDPYLDENLVKKRDYISVDGLDISFRENAKNILENIKGIFTIADAKKLLPGTQQYTIEDIFFKSDKIIKFESGNYINIDEVGITEDIKVDLLEQLNKMFDKLNSDVISIKKLYAYLRFTNNSSLKKMNYINNSFRLYSVIQHLFKDKFYMRRPIISKTYHDGLNTITQIHNYAKTLNQFNASDISNYCLKMQFRTLYSYLEFMIEMSEDYIQIDISTMMKKELLNISKSTLKAIKNAVNYYCNSFKELNTATYQGYAVLPLLRIKWNKYLLVGIIRTYFDDEFEIENTAATFDTTEYIIRRKS